MPAGTIPRRAAGASVCAALLPFAARRMLLLGAALAPRRPLSRSAAGRPAPHVALVVPARDEAPVLPRLLSAIDALSHPREALSVVLVSDGSRDETAAIAAAWAATRAWATVIALPEPSGKPAALNAGIAAAPADAMAIAILDADQRPRPDALARLVAALDEPNVGAVAAYIAPANADASLVARYAALAAWVHQLVTSAGKDRLGLDPPALGGLTAFRRNALASIGGIPDVAGEDVAATLALVSAGWRTRIDIGAVTENDVVATPAAYWRQHLRWSRGLMGTARSPASSRAGGPASAAQRVEALLVSAGYLDRIALASAALLARRRVLPRWVPLAALVPSGAEIVVAVALARRTRELPQTLAAAALCLPLDVAATVVSVAALLRPPMAGWVPHRAAR